MGTLTLAPSLDEGAAGQPQEDVLEGRAADEDRFGPEASIVNGDGHSLAILGVQEDPVRQVLDPIGQPVELAVEGLLDADREAELGDLAGAVLVDERAR